MLEVTQATRSMRTTARNVLALATLLALFLVPLVLMARSAGLDI